jgi:MarR family transcriptional repressor of emrRAB
MSDGRLENLVGAWSLHAVTRVDAALARATGLGAADRAALVSLLGYAGGEHIDTLRRGLRLSQPGSAHAVERLRRLGLVERRRSTRDARAAELHLTADGARQARVVLDERRRMLDELLAPLAEAERAALEAMLVRLLGTDVPDADTARHVCRLCDADACGHPERCPVTQAYASAQPNVNA